MKLQVTFDDGRPDFTFDTTLAASKEPFAWDGRLRSEAMRPLEGYPVGMPASIGSKAILRLDRVEDEGLRLDVTWFDCLVSEGTAKRPHFEAGVEMFAAAEEAGRAVQLVEARDVPHVAEVDIDGRICLQRRFGMLCRIDRTRAASRRYAAYETGSWRELYVTARGRGEDAEPSVLRDPDALSFGSVAALHELVRKAHPDWFDKAASAAMGRPVWDEGSICAEHGYPQGAWWRCALLDRFEGGFYAGLDAEVADLLTVWPAVEWFRNMAGEEASVQDACDWFGMGSRMAFSALKRAWLGLPDSDLNVAWESAWAAAAARSAAG